MRAIGHLCLACAVKHVGRFVAFEIKDMDREVACCTGQVFDSITDGIRRYPKIRDLLFFNSCSVIVLLERGTANGAADAAR